MIAQLYCMRWKMRESTHRHIRSSDQYCCDIEEFSAIAISIQALEPTADVLYERHLNKEFSTWAIC
jgi:hypothetical protein